MPLVQRRGEIEEWVYGAARAHLTRQPREGVHVSDLLSPRKAYWAQVSPKPPSDREVGFFMAGRGHEEILVALTGLRKHHKIKGTWEEIGYEIDILAPIGESEVPIEIKTNRRPKVATPEEVMNDYALALRQLGSYAAITGHQTAYLIMFHLMARGRPLMDEAQTDGTENSEADEQDDPFEWLRQSRPEIIVYQVDWTDEELETIRQGMRGGRDLLELAWAVRDHTLLPECEPFMCGAVQARRHDPRCPRCGKVYGNRRMRKCEDCKTGGKRLDLVRDIEEVFVPTCRWWEECRPENNWGKYLDNYWKSESEVP